MPAVSETAAPEKARVCKVPAAVEAARAEPLISKRWGKRCSIPTPDSTNTIPFRQRCTMPTELRKRSRSIGRGDTRAKPTIRSQPTAPRCIFSRRPCRNAQANRLKFNTSFDIRTRRDVRCSTIVARTFRNRVLNLRGRTPMPTRSPSLTEPAMRRSQTGRSRDSISPRAAQRSLHSHALAGWSRSASRRPQNASTSRVRAARHGKSQRILSTNDWPGEPMDRGHPHSSHSLCFVVLLTRCLFRKSARWVREFHQRPQALCLLRLRYILCAHRLVHDDR